MIIFKFTKTKQSALSAHVDTLRAVTYLFRRAGISAEYSQGFNPHMELTFSPPLSLGTESLCEYVSVKAIFKHGMLDEINSKCPVGLNFVGYAETNEDKNLATFIQKSEYILAANNLGNIISEITKPNYSITYTDKTGEVTKDVSSRIFSAEKIDDNTAKVVLAVGNDNLRPDRLLNYLCNKYNLGDYTAVKTKSFANDKDVDEVLQIKIK